MIRVRPGSALDVDAMTWASSRTLRDQWCAAATAPNSLMLVAEQAGHIRGKAVLDFGSRPGIVWVSMVSVDPAHRGRGVGTAIMRQAETETAARGRCFIDLAVDDANPRARSLYERLGYRAVGPYLDHVHYVDDDGAIVDRIEPGTLLRRTMPPAVVVDYDPHWVNAFRAIAQEVGTALRGMPHAVEHIGSTSVPGLAAKPIIDLFAVVESAKLVAGAITALEASEWPHEGDGGLPGREMFRSRPGLAYHHLYVVVRGSEQHGLQTQFRDILRNHPDARVEYETLKRELAPLLATDRAAYTEGKTAVIESIIGRYGR